MGPNGSGKSTLASVLAGREGYEVTSGAVTYKGRDLLETAPEIRAREGVFMAFQYPVEIPGVTNMYFLREALNAVRKHRGEEEFSAGEFLKVVREKIGPLQMDRSMLKRAVNEGFSGGEKKRNEIFSNVDPGTGAGDSRRDRFGARYRRAEDRRRRRQRPALGKPLVRGGDALPALAQLHCPRTTCMFWPTAGSSSRAASRWRSSWKKRVTAGSKRPPQIRSRSESERWLPLWKT